MQTLAASWSLSKVAVAEAMSWTSVSLQLHEDDVSVDAKTQQAGWLASNIGSSRVVSVGCDVTISLGEARE
jgi:hypothetical protein